MSAGAARRVAVAFALALAFAGVASIAGADAARAGEAPDHACRFWGMIGAPDDGILDLQLVSGAQSMMVLGGSNRDGWGAAYWAPGLSGAGLTRPQVLRGGPPANHAGDHRYRDAAAEIGLQDANCAVVHVRAASSGHADVPDPHPFVRGSRLLAHNGTVNTSVMLDLLEAESPGYLEKHPPDYTTPHIDSELYFLYVLQQIELGAARSLGPALHSAALRMYDAGAVATSINAVAADGDSLYALRFDNNNSSSYKLRYRRIGEAWFVASQPVGADTTGWSVIPPKTLAVFAPQAAPRFVTVFPPPGAYLALEGTKLDDDALGPSQGNGDGVPNAGETLEIDAILSNAGGSSATQIYGILRASDTTCVVLDSTSFFPTLAPGAQGTSVTPFLVRVQPTAPSYFVSTFTLELHAQIAHEGRPVPAEWTRTFKLSGRSPVLALSLATITDESGGHLQPGEQGFARVALENRGAVAATSIQAVLHSTSPHLEVLQAVGAIDTLGQGLADSLVPPFEIRVLPGAPDPEILTADLDVSADWGISARFEIEIPVGGWADPLESGALDWSHAAGIGGYSDAWHLSPLRNHTPGGAWSWHCGAPDSGAAYPDLVDAVLASPIVPLARQTQLRFWHYIRSELAQGHFGEVSDGGLVEASINGGPWTQLFPATGYDFVASESYPPGPFPPGTPLFGGFWLWREEVFYIEGYEGTVQFRFRFGSDGASSMPGLEGWFIDDVRVLGTNTPSAAPEPIALPRSPALAVGGPNPFRESTLILYDVVEAGEVELTILDLEGRLVRRLVQGARPTGRHRLQWDGRDGGGRPVPAGLYFYRLRSAADAFEEVRRVIRVR